MAIVETGYLEPAYLSEYPYLSGQIYNGVPTQVDRRITSAADDPIVYTQVDRRISNPADDPVNFIQVNRLLDEAVDANAVQVDRQIFEDDNFGTQIDFSIVDSQILGMQIKRGTLSHANCGGYLVAPYLTEAYLAYNFCASLNTQVEKRILNEGIANVQVDRKIVSQDDDFFGNAQVDRRIFDSQSVLTQVNRVRALRTNVEITRVLYNTTQLRILCDFPSRGTEALGGNNWTSVQSVFDGDYSPNNLNTDIVEQMTKTSSVANWQLRCDTGNTNTFVDTIGILNHNFSRSARVEVSASDDPAFSSIKFNFVMLTELENMYYIAPTLPNIPARYYQFTIQDPGNADSFLSVGTIVFGSSIILSKKEQFVNPVSFGRRHFKNSIQTEGYTSVSNDRATRRFLNLTYSQLIREGGNFRALQNYITDAKTDLKCLIIPRPTVPSALAVFSKMSQLPEEQHNAIDDNNWRIDMTFDWDESL